MDLTFKVTDYQREAMFDDYADGTAAQYDAATVEVLTGALRGRTFQVYITSGSPEAAFWSQTGREFSAQIDPDLLQSADVVYSGAFQLHRGGQ